MLKFRLISVLVIAVLIVIGWLMLKYLNTPKIYEDDYYSKLNLRNTSYEYEDIINNFGEPLDKVKNAEYETCVNFVYDEFYFVFHDDKFLDIYGHGIAEEVVVVSPKYRFGKYDIGVGSTKSEVEKAYTNVRKVVYNDNDYFYRDGENAVTYYYDDNNVVSKIAIGLSMH